MIYNVSRMSPLDRHIRFAQNQLTVGQFVEQVAGTLLVAAGAIGAAIVIQRLCDVHLRGAEWWAAGTVGRR